MKPVVVIYTDIFLPNGQSWIWRQVKNIENVSFIIISHERSNKDLYPFDPIFIVNERKWLLLEKIKYKIPSIFKLWRHHLQKASIELLTGIFKEQRVSIVHAHFGTNGTKIMEMCRSTGVPLIVTFHGFDITAVPNRWPGYRKSLKDLFVNAKIIIAISEFIRERLIASGCGPEKIHVSYLGVPENEFQFVDRKSRVGAINFTHLGRIVEKKGVPDLIRAFHRAFPHKESVELRIIGSGEELEKARELVDDLKVVNPVIFQNDVSSDLVKKVLEEADVFVLNSMVDSHGSTEGLPIALLEAMASGLPVISTFHAGIPEAVIDQRSGYLIKERDVAGLSIAMRSCLDRERNFRLGRVGREIIERKFSLKNCNKVLSGLYEIALR